MGPLRLICAWFAREIHDRASKVQFWQILGRFWTPKSIKNRSEIVICAWLAREIHELPELLMFWSILEAIFMKSWCQKRAWNEIRKDVKQVKALHCRLYDFVKKLMGFWTFQGFDGCCNVTEGWQNSIWYILHPKSSQKWFQSGLGRPLQFCSSDSCCESAAIKRTGHTISCKNYLSGHTYD